LLSLDEEKPERVEIKKGIFEFLIFVKYFNPFEAHRIRRLTDISFPKTDQ